MEWVEKLREVPEYPNRTNVYDEMGLVLVPNELWPALCDLVEAVDVAVGDGDPPDFLDLQDLWAKHNTLRQLVEEPE